MGTELFIGYFLTFTYMDISDKNADQYFGRAYLVKYYLEASFARWKFHLLLQRKRFLNYFVT